MTPRERLGLGLVRRMLARLSLAARVQELEAELREARAAEHAARGEALKAAADRARAALRAQQMEREAVALRTRMEQAERDAEDLRKLEEEAQERARQAEGERDEAQRLLEAARAELRARGAADHEPPRGASPLDAVARVPNLRRHRRDDLLSRCLDCHAGPAEIATGKPCPGPKGGDGGR